MTAHNYVPNGAGKSYDYSQDHCFVKVSSGDTNGELCVVEDLLKPGFYLARHHHRVMTEVFYVLEGEVEFIFDDQAVVAGPGDTVTAPAFVWHAARCEKGGRMLTVFHKGRFDQFLERLSGMTEDQFQDAALMKSVSEEFDIYDEGTAD